MMRWRNDNMLLRIGQADAYAMACEYVKESDSELLKKELLKFEKYHRHPTYHKLPAGTYTDDTQMSVSVAETLISSNFDTQIFSNNFFYTFKRDQRDGYSRPLQKILEEAKDPQHFRQLIVPNSNKNGAAMRAVPIGVLKDPQQVVEVASRQAAITHDMWGGRTSAAAVALMSHYALYDSRDFSSMFNWCKAWLPDFECFTQPWYGRVDQKNDRDIGIGMITAWAVCTLLQEQTSLLGIMRQVIEWGGDTDSVAAIAWGIASCRYQDEQLPEFFECDLERENGSAYGPEFLKQLGKQLMDSYK